jgi:hypothetical protein
MAIVTLPVELGPTDKVATRTSGAPSESVLKPFEWGN